MTDPIELPALDGRDPLGFLAALGTLRLLADHHDPVTALSFDDRTAVARLHSRRLTALDDLVSTIVGILDTIPPDGVIPGVPATFPASKVGVAADPMRVARDEFRTAAGTLTGGEPAAARWLAALVTDLAADAKGRAALTPYTAPAGQQSLRSLFAKPLEEVRKDPTTLIRQAFTGWRRVDGYTGEYLDHRVVRGAADHPSGKSVEAGVPGATWLAIMALSMLRLTGDGSTVAATGWHQVPGRRQPVMLWPLWRQPLDRYAVTALLEHRDLRLGDGVTVNPARWAPLGVFTVAAAARRPVEGRKSAGVLAPIPVTINGPTPTKP
ncbi:hypothetical protein O7543_25300 [Solwaraspora sp. WMMA2080]|uniref:type I-G CRISPR-associated protein, Cas3-extension family n=1 Tax=unclassified Solwaraspora TaxID=2627926 RepID=UPI00248B0A8E|nr:MULTISPECIES: hypothetical protein [unclassified Solwaraspora]WBB96015.1 hypothetical protein O7553_22075 [Solwaraspora sp. WMMA2059]WBC20081.1 hypothetical protein O7543_25300 [Solwaraspora sp. WMMA2080]